MVLRLTEEEYQRLLTRRSGAKQERPSYPHWGRKAELEFAAALDALVIPYQREFEFLPDRKFRFDFVLLPLVLKLAVEIDGAVHRIESRFHADREKGNLALAAGWRVVHIGVGQVRTGEAAVLIRGALLQNPIRTATVCL